MTIKEAENFITAAAQCGIEFHKAAILIQEKIINSGQKKFTSEQWGEMLQLWECETAMIEQD